MTAILTALMSTGVLKWIGIAFVSGASIVAAWLHGSSTGQKKAAAEAQVSIDAANAQASVAKQQTAEAQADAQAAQEGAAATLNRAEIDNAIAAKSNEEVRNELANWTRD